MRALVAEDDATMAKLVRVLLEGEGFAVDTTASGEEALLLALETPYDAIVLDLNLPDRTGLTIVHELRARRRDVAILILTGRASPDDMIRGLDVGADDYLVKPFDNGVLRARLRALVRRGGAQRSEVLSCGPLQINRITREALVNGVAIPFAPRELRLLEHLALHVDRTVSRSDLLEHVWDMQFDPGTNVVDSLVARVRRKLRAAGPEPVIQTVVGQGYRLVASARQAMH